MDQVCTKIEKHLGRNFQLHIRFNASRLDITAEYAPFFNFNKDEITVSQMRIAFIFDTATIKFFPKQSALVNFTPSVVANMHVRSIDYKQTILPENSSRKISHF
ncbi:hypothetical protein T06_7059 [Trichinella sp. T6]|nr:hypothetical protein T06_7059 [Trichinella sp. T6]